MKNVKWVYIISIILMMIGIPLTVYLIIKFEKTQQSSKSQVTASSLNSQRFSISPTQLVLETPTPVIVRTREPTKVLNPSPEDWKEWPVLPNYISDQLKQLYQQGIENGNNPHAFSIFGDCHSLPDIFLGVYDNDPDLIKTLDSSIQDTVSNFQGSFDRYSPTVKIGTTEGALLWPLWNDNEEGLCEPNENAVDCELRVHKPSIVLIRVGTHYESRNEQYLIRIIDKLLAKGIVPIIVTKADNRELDERINETLIRLAAQYDLPVWNFWASVQHLDTQGINPDDDMYLTDEAYEIHTIDGIKVLDRVWHALNSND